MTDTVKDRKDLRHYRLEVHCHKSSSSSSLTLSATGDVQQSKVSWNCSTNLSPTYSEGGASLERRGWTRKILAILGKFRYFYCCFKGKKIIILMSPHDLFKQISPEVVRDLGGKN